MKRVVKMLLPVCIAFSFICLSQIGFAEELSTGEKITKEEQEKKKKKEAKKEATEMDEMVVTATRTETPIEHIAGSVTIVTREEIENRGQATLSDVLKDIPGIAVTQSGGPGNHTTIRMRGGEDRFVKLLINGMAIGDYATGTTPHYDLWNFLGTEDIERIEVIRGPQSALYGSDAISGVVNIITKRGRGEPKFFLKGEGGSLDTRRASGGVNGSYEGFSYNLTLSYNENGGMYEHSEFTSKMASGRFGYQFNDDMDISLFLQYTDSSLNMGGQSNDTTMKVYDDPRAYRKAKLFYSNLEFRQKITSFWDHKLTLGYDKEEKKPYDPYDGVLDETDNINDKKLVGKYVSPVIKVHWQNNFYIGDIDTVTAGFEYQKVDIDRRSTSSTVYSVIDKSENTKSGYLQNQLLLLDESLSFISGVRLDDDSAFGDHTTYNLGLAYILKNYGTKFKATYGTGFAAPSMFNLYHPEYGNPDLKPEESESWDVGIEQKLFQDKVAFEVTYFSNDFKDMIAYDSSLGHYINRENADSNGIEAGITLHLLKNLNLSAYYTFTEGSEDGTDLAKVPKHSVLFNAMYKFGGFVVGADVNYVGDRLAWDHKEENRLDEFTMVNVYASYQINKYINIFARVENLLDEDYTLSPPWQAPKIGAYGGVRLTF